MSASALSFSFVIKKIESYHYQYQDLEEKTINKSSHPIFPFVLAFARIQLARDKSKFNVYTWCPLPNPQALLNGSKFWITRIIKAAELRFWISDPHGKILKIVEM